MNCLIAVCGPFRHTSQRWGNVMGAGKGLFLTSPLSYLSHKPLLWSVNMSSGTAATTEQVIYPQHVTAPAPTPTPSPSRSQFKVSQRPNSIDPVLNPALQPLLAAEDRHCLLPNMHCRLCRKEEMLCKARQADKCTEWERERGPNSLIYNWQCFSVGKPALICCLITDFHNRVQTPLRHFCGLFTRCLHCKLAFQKGTSPSSHSLQHTRCFFFFFLSYLVLLSANNNLQLTFTPLWIIQILFSYQGRSQARQLSFICVLCQSKA